MDPATTLALIQTILAAIQTLAQLQSLFSISHCRSELDDLHNTVETVRAVLEDADARQDSLNAQEKHYIQELKDAVYDADDVLDEFLTLAKQNQLRRNKVTSFLSHQFKILTHRITSKVKMVNNKLNTIATKSTMYSFKVDYKPIKFTKEETSSCLSDVIIGREDDVEKIVGVLLGSHNVDHPNVSLLAIMGMGGLGKTALAQLVYNDPRITEAFPLKRWTCIADQDQQQLDLKGHLAKVVKGFSVSDKTSLEDIHNEDKQQLGGKKYLLVLDDVWTESYDQWQKFKGFLNVGGRGSWIIVTTRSKTTAQMIGTDGVHEVQGLTEPESWHLFERMAFQGVERDDELVKLGKKIVKKCTNVPLAIRVVGSLLRGQSLSKWLSFHDKGLDCLSESNDAMMTRILKLSYDQLNPPLRTCFAYCAIFPKDQRISKKMLIQLWMAQGYINSEDLGEEYFLILLHRCFFQDIDEDEFGGIKSFKIHDLLHDIAEKVAGEEICRFSFDTSSVGKRVRHLSLVRDSYAQSIFNNSQIRTCLFIAKYYEKRKVDQLLASKSLAKWTCLRSLDLSHSYAKSLPKSIGKLLHLRSLDLSYNRDLKVLPKSITKLVNLQTLNLYNCMSLKQLPDDVSKLVDLSTLNVAECDALSHMPAGISMLTSLRTLCQFVVGARTSSASKQCFNGLEDLKHLNKLKGELTIEIAVLKNAKFVKEEHGGGGYLRCKEHLETIVINFRRGEEYGSKESEQALLEEMEPHRDVKALELKGYHGETIPRWPGRGDNSALFDFPNLVTLRIVDCSELLYLPWQIGKLPRLKTLQISKLLNMEYVADSETLVSGEGSSFFPCLDFLEISELPKLKGWWCRSESGLQEVNLNDSESSQEAHLVWVSSPCFPLLTRLSIRACEKMMLVPLCPRLEHLEIHDSRRELLWTDMRSTPDHQPSSSSSYPKLKRLEINNYEWLKSMPSEYTQFLSEIKIESDKRMERLGEVNEFPTSLLSSVQTLRISFCPELVSVRGWLEHLSALEYLVIYQCPKVELDGMSWHNLAGSLQHLSLSGLIKMEELPEGLQYCTSLRDLDIWFCPKLKSMPKWMQYCTSLQSLSIKWCPKLKSMPKWMPKLTSLQELEISLCSESLIERCQEPNGEDWPLIQHISSFIIW
ncbi:putative disease resistance protein RGA1 [Silene latifolia]|uniref:putative disease resistance protein RGA1 n=1 Tax=Silene latifolia TaxID=37657 RepID=UPI003D76CFDF